MDHLSFLKSFANSGGDWVIYILIAASIFCVAVIVERFIIILRQRFLVDEWEKTMAENWKKLPRHEIIQKIRETASDQRSVLSRVVKDVVDHSGQGSLSRDQQLEIRLGLEKRYLEKRLLVLGTLGNNAPFVGLLGTVLGVIRAFRDLASTAGGPEVVMQGLSEALIATAVGILVAIPCVASYNYLQKRVKDLLSDLDHLGKRIIALVEAEESHG